MYSRDQEQTKETFSYKWSRQDSYESEILHEAIQHWIFERYCQGDPGRLTQMLEGGRKTILDAGCGAGVAGMLFFGDHLHAHDYIGIDISSSVDVAKLRFEKKGLPGRFMQANLFNIPIDDASLDLIFADGVLHHTDSTERAIEALARKLKNGGHFLFYVYAKKSPIREFTDDLVREALKGLDNEEAWEALKPLTKLGIALGELNQTIEISEDIPYLGIKKGKMDIQRLFYWHICKMYYRPGLNLDENNHVNFDWFRPLNCHRHTIEEVQGYCQKASLEILHTDQQESGISIVSVKR